MSLEAVSKPVPAGLRLNLPDLFEKPGIRPDDKVENGSKAMQKRSLRAGHYSRFQTGVDKNKKEEVDESY
jgi:hypothetical protein